MSKQWSRGRAMGRGARVSSQMPPPTETAFCRWPCPPESRCNTAMGAELSCEAKRLWHRGADCTKSKRSSPAHLRLPVTSEEASATHDVDRSHGPPPSSRRAPSTQSNRLRLLFMHNSWRLSATVQSAYKATRRCSADHGPTSSAATSMRAAATRAAPAASRPWRYSASSPAGAAIRLSWRHLPTCAKSNGPTTPWRRSQPMSFASAAKYRAAAKPICRGRRHAACRTIHALFNRRRALRAQISTICDLAVSCAGGGM
mmetsp:Transcript_132973/g.384504  ORF Transcript_132973/g.384504 Transcript_132973/m.384504 type:complete len:258 (+) Transcript_132973:159-932(+)